MRRSGRSWRRCFRRHGPAEDRDTLVSKAEDLKSELIKAYLKFMASARNYEATIEKEDFGARLPAAFRKIIGRVTERHKLILNHMKAAA